MYPLCCVVLKIKKSWILNPSRRRQRRRRGVGGGGDTEAGFCAGTRQMANGTGVFAGFLKHIESRPNSINMLQYDPYNPKLTI